LVFLALRSCLSCAVIERDAFVEVLDELAVAELLELLTAGVRLSTVRSYKTQSTDVEITLNKVRHKVS